jgi:hypothetical protein
MVAFVPFAQFATGAAGTGADSNLITFLLEFAFTAEACIDNIEGDR